jgi:hypothetical protein
MAAATVSISVEELAKLIKHADAGMFYFNLIRRGNEFHRCLRVQIVNDLDPTFRFELTEDDRIVRTAMFKLNEIFDLLPSLSAAMPRLLAFLKEQAE